VCCCRSLEAIRFESGSMLPRIEGWTFAGDNAVDSVILLVRHPSKS
jgi:hypothetical protein